MTEQTKATISAILHSDKTLTPSARTALLQLHHNGSIRLSVSSAPLLVTQKDAAKLLGISPDQLRRIQHQAKDLARKLAAAHPSPSGEAWERINRLLELEGVPVSEGSLMIPTITLERFADGEFRELWTQPLQPDHELSL